jgi:hypothetical protein
MCIVLVHSKPFTVHFPKEMKRTFFLKLSFSSFDALFIADGQVNQVSK